MDELAPRILLIEDDVDAACLIQESLEDYFGDGCVTCYSLVSESSEVDAREFDIVLCDLNLPDGTGFDLLDTYLGKGYDVPIVMVTAVGVLESAMKAVRMGAYDYVIKAGDYLFSLPVVIEKNLALHRIKQENEDLRSRLERTLDQLQFKNMQLEEAVMKLENMAATDPLTGLSNRRAFARALDRYFAAALRDGGDIACVMIDLDGFKPLNDVLGHQSGDQILQQTARVLQQFVRKSDLAGRFGGDEFVLLLPNTSEVVAVQVAKRIQKTFMEEIAKEVNEKNAYVHLSMSMGVATKNLAGVMSSQRLVGCADQALYAAKRAGKGCLMTFKRVRDSKIA